MHRHNLLTLMLAHAAAADDLAIAVHGANVERDRMRRRRLMLTDALRRLLPQIGCPLAGIWGEQDVLYRDRPGLVAQTLPLAADYRGLTMLPGAGHWAPYEAAADFDAAFGAWLLDLRSCAARPG
jgi:2-hydroxy-6-oxonona-2,4-dienedioate hydrolase